MPTSAFQGRMHSPSSFPTPGNRNAIQRFSPALLLDYEAQTPGVSEDWSQMRLKGTDSLPAPHSETVPVHTSSAPNESSRGSSQSLSMLDRCQ
ncbi:MAG: hypothetical protein ACOC35_05245 [Promethearchaeia archaeon]